MKQILQVWKKVFEKPKYLIAAIAVAFLFYMLNVIIPNFSTLKSYLLLYGLPRALSLLIALSSGFKDTIEFHSFITLIITSILFAVLISLIFFKLSNMEQKVGRKAGALGTLGLILAVLAPGCAACGLGLIAVLGLSGVVLTFLPLEGLEISMLAILILAAAIFKISKDLTICNACRIKFNFKSKNQKHNTYKAKRR